MPINARDKYLQKFIEGVLEEGKSETSRFYYDDPTTMGFNLWFQFEGVESPLFNESDNGESAIRYLEAIDEPERAQALRDMKQTLKDLVSIYPYYFTELSGLGSPYVFNPDVGYESDRLLEIKTMESIDIRMGRLIEQYIFAFFDIPNRRQMIPGNLLEFRISVIISEIRNFRTFINGTVKSGPAGSSDGGTQVIQGSLQDFGDRITQSGGGAKLIDGFGVDSQPTNAADIQAKLRNQADDGDKFPYTMKEINANLSAYVYEFRRCRFDFSTSQPFLESISNSESVMATNSFKIMTGRMTTSHKLNFLDLFIEDSGQGQGDVSQQKPTTAGKRSDTRIEKALKKLVNKNIGIASTVFKAESDAFLQENDPRLAASRFVQNNLVAKFDSKFKAFLFGNAFNLGTNARSEVISRSLEQKNITKNDILLPTLESGTRDSLDVRDTGEMSNDSPDLGNRDIGVISGNSKDLPSRTVSDQKDSTKSELGTKDVGSLDINRRTDFGTKDFDGISGNSIDLGDKDVLSAGPNASTDLDAVDTGVISTNPVDLGSKETNPASVNPNDLDVIQTNDPTTNPQDLGQKEFDGITNSVNSIESIDLGSADLGSSSDLGNKNVGDISKNSKDLSNINVGDIVSGISKDLSAKDVGSLTSGMVQQLSGVNTNQLSKNPEELSKIELVELPINNLLNLGIKEVAGMDLLTLKNMGIIKLNELDMKTIEDLGDTDVGELKNRLQLMKDNVSGFEDAPFSSIIESFVKSHLGNVISKKTNVTDHKDGLGNVFKTEERTGTRIDRIKLSKEPATPTDQSGVNEDC